MSEFRSSLSRKIEEGKVKKEVISYGGSELTSPLHPAVGSFKRALPTLWVCL
jgi:hypothetical protein